MISSPDNDPLFITAEEAGQRLDKLLVQRYPERSRTYFEYLIENHLVLLNGAPVKKREKPKAGDEIEIEFALTEEISLEPEAIPLDIIYEDEHLLAINKPAGMVVHPAPGHWTGTFVNALLHHCKTLHNSSESLRPGIVHRLDKETSGVLLAAKTELAHRRLVEQFASHQMRKEYIGICIGNPGTREINAPIGRHPVHRKQMAIVEQGGKNAITFCHSLGHDEKLSVVRILLKTGRTHQIRVHMKHLNTPILGDATYGRVQTNKTFGADRQLLHAAILSFSHPITEKPLILQAKIPSDLLLFIQRIIPNFNETSLADGPAI